MFYWIKNWKVFIISEEKTKVKVDKWVESDVVNWVYEDWKIVPKEESEEYKKQMEEYKQKMLEEEIQKINKCFDKTIKDYIKAYPEMEVETWETKRVEAEKVLAWQESEYLNKLAEAKGVDVKELAKKIKEKADAYADMYTKLEAEKDKKIEELKQKLK